MCQTIQSKNAGPRHIWHRAKRQFIRSYIFSDFSFSLQNQTENKQNEVIFKVFCKTTTEKQTKQIISDFLLCLGLGQHGQETIKEEVQGEEEEESCGPTLLEEGFLWTGPALRHLGPSPTDVSFCTI